jgi:hypothetical protein
VVNVRVTRPKNKENKENTNALRNQINKKNDIQSNNKLKTN